MIGPDGRVRKGIPIARKKELMNQGFRIIVNPKQEYYFEYDGTNQSWNPDLNVLENVDPADFLEVEAI